MRSNRNKQFKNTHNNKFKRSFFNYLLWQFGFYNDKNSCIPMPQDFSYPNCIENVNSPYKITWVNHSTFLIEALGITFLTDPIFNKRCSPLPFIGPKRKHQPEPRLDHLPGLDFVLISHNHYDHMDKRALKKLYKANPLIKWVVPLGVKSWFLKNMKEVDPEFIIELNWHDSKEFLYKETKIRFAAVPAQHFSGRGFFDKNRSLWMGLVVEVGEKRFYFAGDTGYNEIDFREIGKRYKKMDLSLLPIGVYTPRAFMKSIHINPEEAVKIHKEVGSLLSVGGHWKTFRLANEPLERPPFDLYCALQEHGLSPDVFRVLNPGQTIAW